MKRFTILFLTALAVFVLALNCVSGAAAQDMAQGLSEYQGPKQNLSISYSDEGIVLEGKGDDAVIYKGLIYIQIYPVSPRLRKKFGDVPMFSAERMPRTGFGTGGSFPLGEYEVHFSIREGDMMRTCIKRGILLTANGGANVEAEMSGTSRTLIIGGDDMTAQQMRDSILQLKQQVAALQAEVAALKGGKAAAVFPK